MKRGFEMGKALTGVIGFVSAIALGVPAVAQSTAGGDEIVVTGEKKKKEIAQALKKLIEPTGRERHHAALDQRRGPRCLPAGAGLLFLREHRARGSVGCLRRAGGPCRRDLKLGSG